MNVVCKQFSQKKEIQLKKPNSLGYLKLHKLMACAQANILISLNFKS